MKKLCIALFCAVLFSQAGMAQNLDSLLKKVTQAQILEIPNTESLAVAQAEALGSTIELPSFVNDITKIEIYDLTTCSEELKLDITEEIQTRSTNNNYETLTQVKNKEKFIKVMLKKEKEDIKELLVFLSKNNSQKVIRIQGTIHEDVLADLMGKYSVN